MHDLNEVQASGVLERSFVRTIGRPSGGRGAKKNLAAFFFFRFVDREDKHKRTLTKTSDTYIRVGVAIRASAVLLTLTLSAATAVDASELGTRGTVSSTFRSVGSFVSHPPSPAPRRKSSVVTDLQVASAFAHSRTPIACRKRLLALTPTPLPPPPRPRSVGTPSPPSRTGIRGCTYHRTIPALMSTATTKNEIYVPTNGTVMEQRPDETEQRQVPTHHQHQQPQPHEDEEEFFVPTDRRGLKRYWALETATIAPLTPDQVCAYIHVVYTHLAASSGYFLRALRYVWFEWFGMREARIRWIRVLLELRVAPEREKIGCVSIVIGMRAALY